MPVSTGALAGEVVIRVGFAADRWRRSVRQDPAAVGLLPQLAGPWMLPDRMSARYGAGSNDGVRAVSWCSCRRPSRFPYPDRPMTLEFQLFAAPDVAVACWSSTVSAWRVTAAA
jgi:hypothetical protein